MKVNMHVDKLPWLALLLLCHFMLRELPGHAKCCHYLYFHSSNCFTTVKVTYIRRVSHINHLCAAQVIVGLCPGGNITLTCTTCGSIPVLAWDSPVIPDSPGALIFSQNNMIGDDVAYGSLQAILVNKTAGCLTSNLTVTASPPVVNGTEINCTAFKNRAVQNWTILIAGE